MKKLLGILCIVLMCVPAVLAFILYKPQQGDAAQSSEVVKVIIKDSLSNEYEVTDADGIKNLSTLVNGTKVDAVADGVLEFPCFDLTFITASLQTVYRVYMSAERTTEIYYTTDGVQYYAGDLLAGRTFMEQAYAVSLYDTGTPVLRVGNGNTVILPSSMTWNYKSVGGSYLPVGGIASSDEVTSVDDAARTLNYTFSKEPTALTIVICGDVDKSYTASEFPELITPQTQYMKLKMIASWETSDTATAYGSAEYTFNVLVRADAIFLANNSGQIKQGGLIELAVKNGLASSLSFTCTPSLGYEPTFYSDGLILRAFIPVACDAAPGEYTVTLTQDGVSESFVYSITERDVKTKTYTSGLALLSDENIAALQAAIAAGMSATTSSAWLAGEEKLRFPTEYQDYHTGYGHRLVIGSTDTVYRHLGIDCRITKNESIYAALSGTVVYVGQTEIYGGIVVVDHGMGLKTWYARVSPSVAVGQTVAQGDLIATADESGFGDAARVHFGVSVKDVFVDPAMIIENGFSHLSFE